MPIVWPTAGATVFRSKTSKTAAGNPGSGPKKLGPGSLLLGGHSDRPLQPVFVGAAVKLRRPALIRHLHSRYLPGLVLVSVGIWGFLQIEAAVKTDLDRAALDDDFTTAATFWHVVSPLRLLRLILLSKKLAQLGARDLDVGAIKIGVVVVWAP
jgi:hypothetical protein